MTKEPFPTFVYLDWNEIERHMLRKGLTIQPLSIKLEMSLRTIKRWRSGCRTQVTKAKELATFLGVTFLVFGAFTYVLQREPVKKLKWP